MVENGSKYLKDTSENLIIQSQRRDRQDNNRKSITKSDAVQLGRHRIGLLEVHRGN